MASEADSVYFAPKDYAHPARRLGAVVIDLAFLIVLLYAILLPAAYLAVPRHMLKLRWTPEVQKEINKYEKPIKLPVTGCWLALCILYHVPLRRTRGGTLGYRVMGIRLVDHSGEAPAIGALGRRFLIAIPATLFLGVSYFSCFSSPKRQTAHDKWSGTWAVRKRATPAGRGITSYSTTFLGTIPMTCVDVEPVDDAQPPSRCSESSGTQVSFSHGSDGGGIRATTSHCSDSIGTPATTSHCSEGSGTRAGV